jgi:choline dehydrogenase-like flavoprotein
MTASSTFDVIFVGAGHHVLIAARYLTENSGSVCLLDRRPIPAKPHTATSESFIDDPKDFKKRSRTGSPDENRTSPNTYWLCAPAARRAGCRRIDSGTGPPRWVAGERGVSGCPA